MFCGKCGAQNLENATFCKECGAPLNSTSSISTGSDMGELLVSTKTGAAGRKVLLCVLCPLLILLGIFIMATPEAFDCYFNRIGFNWICFILFDYYFFRKSFIL